MQRYIKKIRIISSILLSLEIALVAFLVSLYFFDFIEGAKTFIEDNYLIMVSTAFFLLVDWIYFTCVLYNFKKIRYKNNLSTANLFGETVKESLSFSQLGIIVVNDVHDIIWTNEIISQIDEHLLDKNILDVFPQLREFQESTEENKIIKVKIKDIIFDVNFVKSSNVYFFKNVTDYDNLIKYSIEQAVVLGIVMIDNYEELAEGQEETSDTLSRVKTKINEYFKEYGVLLRKYSSNSYFAICNYDSLHKMREDGFNILDIVKEQAVEDELVPTLSIGFAHDFPSIYKLNEMALNAIDIAISRGGDQVVVSKYASDIEFFGGRSEGIEKRNKVKVRILADSLVSLLKSAKNVLVMGHKDMDMDALGSTLGIKAICDSIGVPCHIIYESKLVEKKAKNAFMSTFDKDKAKEIALTPKEALSKIASKTILVCVDFHRPSLAMSKELLDKCDKVVVIDHHRRSEEFIDNPIFTYFEITASSASELITELINYSSHNPAITIPPEYATIMLAGIFLDTNYFRSTTSGFRTFEASMFLRNFGADNITADEFLKDDYEEHMMISEIISTMKTPYTEVAYCINPKSQPIEQATLAKVANECMSMRGISAAFALGKISENEVKVSARSDGKINVQLLCEKMGGGGHFTMAAAIIKTKDILEAVSILEDVLKIYLDDARKETQED